MEEFMKHEMNHQLAVCYKVVIRVMLVKVAYIYIFYKRVIRHQSMSTVLIVITSLYPY